MTLIVNVVQMIVIGMVKTLSPDLLETSWFIWVLVGISFYMVGFPTFWAMTKEIPNALDEHVRPMRMRTFVCAFFICMAAVYLFNIVGIGINAGIAFVKGKEVMNPISEVISSSSTLFTMIFAGMLSPLVEEIIFRGILLRKLRNLGDKTAIVATALAFGLFHGNFSQFFYAVALGLIFGYIAVKTNSIRYTVLLHIIINMFGSVIMPILMTSGNSIILALASLLVLTFFILGIVFFFIYRKRIKIEDVVTEPKEKHIFRNYGVGGYLLVSVLLFAIVIIS
jgi:membrane protease YdiL (CAAX protease family)